MNQHFQPRRARPAYGQRQQRQEQRPDQDNQGQQGDEQELTLDQHAGAVARGIIKATGVEDSTEIWRALKRAYLTGYDEASR